MTGPQTPPHSLGAWTLALALGLSACTSMAPSHERPPLPVPQRYAEGNGTAPSGPLAAWEDLSSDPRLNALVSQALANNRDRRVALLRVEEARAAYGIQRADRLPTIGLGFDAARSRVPGDLNVTGHSVTGDQFQLGVGLSSWELDLWGRVRNLSDAALQSYLATDAAGQAVTSSLVAQVANGYLGLLEYDKRLDLARRSAASREESLRIFRRRVELGATSRLEMLQVDVLWRQATALVAQLEQGRAAQLHALSLLVGAPVNLDPAGEGLDRSALFREVEPGTPSDLLLRRPDIVATEHRLQAANANIGAARAAFFPRIALTGSFGTASAELDGLFKGGSDAWTFAPGISLPIFDGGRRQASLDLAQVRKDQAVVAYEQAVQAAFRDVSDALSARRWLEEQREILRATLAVQTERTRLAKLRYDSGAARYLEVLDAERELLAAQQQLVQIERARLAAQVTLYAALGGGSSAGTPAAGTP